MKKILVLQGSPRAESISAALCNRMLSVFGDEFEISVYNAYKMNASPCLACGRCDKNEGCFMHDLDDFTADFMAADYFIISTPVYNGGVPAPLKAIVDRFQFCYALRFSHGRKPPVEKPKKAALIITAGSKGEGRQEIEDMFRRQFTVLNTRLTETLFVDSTDTKSMGAEEYDAAVRCGERLLEGK